MSVPVLEPVEGGLLRAAQVWERVRARVEQRLLQVDLAVCARFERALTDTERTTAHTYCDQLASWLGQLGLTGAAELARELRDCFGTGVTDAAAAAHMATLSEDLRTILAVSAPEVEASERPGPLVLAVGPPSRAIDGVLWVASVSGMRVAHVPPTLPPISLAPACVFVAIEDRPAAGRPTLRAVREQFPQSPIVATASRLGISDRAELAAFTDVLLPGSTQPREVLHQVRSLVFRRSLPVSIALAGAVQELAPALRDRGIDVVRCLSGAAIVEALHAGDARGALLVDRRPGVDAVSVLHIVRSDPRIASCPISVIVEDQDALRRAACWRAGADDVWVTNFSLDELALRCRARLQRSAELTSVRDLDGPVASFSQAQASLLIERMLVAALRRNMPVAVGVLHFGGSVDHARIAEVAEPLAREFRREDVVGRFDDRFVVALQGVGRATAVRRFEDVLRRLDLQDGGCRVGVAEFPLDGRALDELVAIARESVNRAHALDGPLVVSPEWRPESDAIPDVLVVDADPTLRELLCGLLERAGHRVAQISDGVEAFEHLTGARRVDLPKLLVTDLELQSMDGLQLLRRLRDAGVLHRMRVVVLTARVQESDLVQALDLGAADVVTKPFSPPLLLHRIERVLTA